ncbi:glycine oxidase ThiO [soil metagenome]
MSYFDKRTFAPNSRSSLRARPRAGVNSHMPQTRDEGVIIVGGGAIGLAVAWRLAGLGRTVTVVDRAEAGQGASWAAGGMLAPTTEVGFEEMAQYELGMESLRRWPEFARDLETATGMSVGYDQAGTISVAYDRDSAVALRRNYDYKKSEGLAVDWLSGDEASEVEPLLSPRLTGAVLSPGDHQVDNRLLVKALLSAARNHPGIELREGEGVRALDRDGEAPVVVLEDGTRRRAGAVILAAGAWLSQIAGLDLPTNVVRPVKGQMLSVAMSEGLALRHVIRGPEAYLVPKPDGRLVVGATSEELGFDTAVTAGGLYRLLEGAVRIVPAVEEMAWKESWAGLRPAARDHAPVLGAGAPGVYFAAGHFRGGILLAPVTADEIAREVDAYLAGGAETSPWLAPFSPGRFQLSIPSGTQ